MILVDSLHSVQQSQMSERGIACVGSWWKLDVKFWCSYSSQLDAEPYTAELTSHLCPLTNEIYYISIYPEQVVSFWRSQYPLFSFLSYNTSKVPENKSCSKEWPHVSFTQQPNTSFRKIPEVIQRLFSWGVMSRTKQIAIRVTYTIPDMSFLVIFLHTRQDSLTQVTRSAMEWVMLQVSPY